MKRERKDKNFIHKPSYPGGNAAFKAFVKKHLTYPKEAAEEGIEGIVRVRYEINYEGKVTDTRVMSGIGYGCDEEAERIVKMLKFDVPKHRGVKVAFHKTTNIRFKLKEAPNTPNSSTTQYVYTTRARSADSKSNSESSGYTYTITIPKK